MECQKQLFQLRPDVHYLNCAYKAPLLKSAEEAAIAALVRNRNPADFQTGDFFDPAIQIRELFSELIHCRPGQVALIPSVAYGMASALNNIPAKSAGKAVTIEDEFPSGIFALKKWCADQQNELHTVASPVQDIPRGASWNQALLHAIDERTSVVVLSAVHWMDGYRFDLAAIGARCAEVGAKLVVDGTQCVGALPINVQELGIHALIVGGYKWLLGPYSLSLAYFSEDFNQGVPLEEAWSNRSNARQFSQLTDYAPDYLPEAARYNMGQSSHFILLPMLKAALEQILAWGPDRIQAYGQALCAPLRTYLHGLDITLEAPEFASQHLFTLPLPGEITSDAMRTSLQAHGVVISVRGNALRLSVNVFNDEADIQQLIRAIEAVRRAPAGSF